MEASIGRKTKASVGTPAPNGAAADAFPFAGRPAWIVTDGKAASEMQCVGVALALGAEPIVKRVHPRFPFRLLAPWGGPSPAARFGQPGADFSPPWPPIVFATGRQSIPYLRALRAAAGSGTYTVVLQDPRTGTATADLICVPDHDRLRGPNVIATLTAPHVFTASRLAALRADPPPAIAGLPHPRVAVLLGGPNDVYRFGRGAIARLTAALKSLADLGASFMVTPSRRTPPALVEAVAAATAQAPRLLWDGKGENPYASFLANADTLIVTADSVNMASEASATGRPVHVFEPDGGSSKFRSFHEDLRRYGATRPLSDIFTRLEGWTYAPLDSAAEIAREIERRWSARQATSIGGST